MPMPRQRRFYPPHQFQPRDLYGLVRDFDASLCNVADGAASSVFPEAVQRADGIQATGGKQATYRASVAVFNGKPALQFAGAQGYQTPAIDLTGTQALTVAGCFTGAAAAVQIILEMDANYASFTDSFAYFIGVQSSWNGIAGAHVGNLAGVSISGERAYSSPPDPIIVTFDKSIVASTTTPEITIYQNGIQSFGSSGETQNGENTNFYGNRVLNIGARNNAASIFLIGYIARLLLWNRRLSALEIQQVNKHLQRTYGTIHRSGQLTFDGDSLTAGFNTASSYPRQVVALMSGRNFAWGQYGVAGITLSQLVTLFPARIAPLYDPSQSNVLVIFAGINDMTTANGSTSAATTYARLLSYTRPARAIGFKPIVVTMIDCQAASVDGTFQTRRADFNNLVTGTPGEFDGIIDAGANATLGANGAANNATNFNADKTHLTTTGYGVLAGLAQPVIEAVTS